MPQASEELRREWPGHDAQAVRYLRARGYSLGDDWIWSPPSLWHTPTDREASALEYLIKEWDYGGLRS